MTATSDEGGKGLREGIGATIPMAPDKSATVGRTATKVRPAATGGPFLSASAVTRTSVGRPRQGSRPPWGSWYTRPFSPWEEISQRVPAHLEVQRFNRLPPERRALSWNRWRAHAPCDVPVPREWNLDALYFRFPEEGEYARRLKDLTPRAGNRLTIDLLCLPEPWIPHRWPETQTPCAANFKNFSPVGDLSDITGGEFALDSAWALRSQSLAAGTGDPSRLVSEYRKEYRDSMRKGQFLVAFHQVEFYEQTPAARKELYPRRPNWWEGSWISQNLVVPLPPVVTYRGRFLLEEYAKSLEGNVWWRVFEVEWTTLVFGRWCTDIPQRGIMWYLPPRVQANIAEIGVENLLLASSYASGEVRSWLCAHDAYDWTAALQKYRIRGPTDTEPEVVETIPEFVRVFRPDSGLAFGNTHRRFSRSTPNLPSASGDPVHPHMAELPEKDVGPVGHPVAGIPVPRLRSAPVAEAVVQPAPPCRGGLLDVAPEDNPDGEGYFSYYDRLSSRSLAGTRYESIEEIPSSLRQKLENAGLTDCLQHYARFLLHAERDSPVSRVPVTEDALVYAFQKTDELRTKFSIDLNEEKALHRLELDRVTDLELRLGRAEAYGDMMKESYLDLCIGATLKRKREDKDWDGREDGRWPGLPYK
jgi:hypothetical protein